MVRLFQVSLCLSASLLVCVSLWFLTHFSCVAVQIVCSRELQTKWDEHLVVAEKIFKLLNKKPRTAAPSAATATPGKKDISIIGQIPVPLDLLPLLKVLSPLGFLLL